MPWFASARYYPCPFSKTVRRFTRERCLNSSLYSDERRNFSCGESAAAKSAVETNTLHGVITVNDLRAWSACSEDRRRYFLEQMLRSGPELSGGANGTAAATDGNENATDQSVPEESKAGSSSKQNDASLAAETSLKVNTETVKAHGESASQEILASDQKEYFLEQMQALTLEEDTDQTEFDGIEDSQMENRFALDHAISSSHKNENGFALTGLIEEKGHLPDDSEWFLEVDEEGTNSVSATEGHDETTENFEGDSREESSIPTGDWPETNDEENSLSYDMNESDRENASHEDGGVPEESNGDDPSSPNGDNSDPNETSPSKNDLIPTGNEISSGDGGDGDPEPSRPKTPATSSKSFTLECLIKIRPTDLVDCGDECEDNLNKPIEIQFEKQITLEFELPEPEPQPEPEPVPTFNMNDPKDCCELLKSAAENMIRLHDTIHMLNGGPVRELPPLVQGAGDSNDQLAETKELYPD